MDGVNSNGAMVTKTLIDIDNDLLTRSQQILGTTTKKDTVNRALGEVVRRRAAEEFIELARGGAFDAVLKGERTEQSWRREWQSRPTPARAPGAGAARERARATRLASRA